MHGGRRFSVGAHILEGNLRGAAPLQANFRPRFIRTHVGLQTLVLSFK